MGATVALVEAALRVEVAVEGLLLIFQGATHAKIHRFIAGYAVTLRGVVGAKKSVELLRVLDGKLRRSQLNTVNAQAKRLTGTQGLRPFLQRAHLLRPGLSHPWRPTE